MALNGIKPEDNARLPARVTCRTRCSLDDLVGVHLQRCAAPSTPAADAGAVTTCTRNGRSA